MGYISEDYCSEELSGMLMERGYIGATNTYLGKDGLNVEQITIQSAMKWLREVHHWHIFVIPRWEDVEYMPGEWQDEMTGYQYVIVSVGEVNRKNEQPITKALTPESACEAAIKYCVENLI